MIFRDWATGVTHQFVFSSHVHSYQSNVEFRQISPGAVAIEVAKTCISAPRHMACHQPAPICYDIRRSSSFEWQNTDKKASMGKYAGYYCDDLFKNVFIAWLFFAIPFVRGYCRTVYRRWPTLCLLRTGSMLHESYRLGAVEAGVTNFRLNVNTR